MAKKKLISVSDDILQALGHHLMKFPAVPSGYPMSSWFFRIRNYIQMDIIHQARLTVYDKNRARQKEKRMDEETLATQATIDRITWLEQKSLDDLQELEKLLDYSVTENKSVKLNLDLTRELFGDQPVQFILAEVREVINFKNIMSIV